MNKNTEYVDIKIKKEVLDFLLNIADAMNSQSNRGNSNNLFTIHKKHKVVCPQGMEQGVERISMDYIPKNMLCSKCRKLYENDKELPEMCSDCDSDCFSYFRYERREPNGMNPTVFFTEEAAKQHIEENSHHYNGGDSNQVMTYGEHPRRNIEITKIMNVIFEITGKEKPHRLNKYFEEKK